MLRPWKLVLAGVQASRSMPLYLQIVHALIHEIERGRLRSGRLSAEQPRARRVAGRQSQDGGARLRGPDRARVAHLQRHARHRRVELAAGRPARHASRKRCRARSSRRTWRPTTSSIRRPRVRWRCRRANGSSSMKGRPIARLFPAEVLSRAYRSEHAARVP